jgi:hypothetical protein
MKISNNKSAGNRKWLRLMALLAVLAIGAVAAVSAFATSRPGKPSISGPHNPTNKTRATFRFHGHGSARYQCSLDGGKIKPCSSPKTYSTLSPGRHSLRIRALDKGGKKSRWASYPWAVDTTAPVVSSITRGQASPTNQSSLLWTVTFTETVTGVNAGDFKVGTNHVGGSAPTISSITPVGGSHGTAWTVAASTTGSSGANDGSVELDVPGGASIADAAGNALGGTPFAGQAYRFDTTAPGVPTGLSGPDNPSVKDSSTPSTIQWQAAADGGDTAGFRCQMDGGAYGSCSSPTSYSNLSAAAHTFDVVAVDAAGNQSEPATYGWTVLAAVQNWTVSGNAPSSLQPGAAAGRINLSFHNPNSYSLSFQSLAVSVQSVTKAVGAVAGPCAAANFATTDFSGAAFTLPPGDSSLSSLGIPTSQWPTIRMLETGQNQDACKGASINFSYQGVATK